MSEAMRTLSDTAEILSAPEVAVDGGKFSGVLGTLRKIYLGRRYEIAIQDIEKAFGCKRRTAERIYAGQTVNADTTFAGLVSEEFGGPILQEALSRIPPDRRIAVALALRDACDLARHKAEEEELIKRMEARVKR
jgi:hypothetical protein